MMFATPGPEISGDFFRPVHAQIPAPAAFLQCFWLSQCSCSVPGSVTGPWSAVAVLLAAFQGVPGAVLCAREAVLCVREAGLCVWGAGLSVWGTILSVQILALIRGTALC